MNNRAAPMEIEKIKTLGRPPLPENTLTFA
jgi:hypothetical protein